MVNDGKPQPAAHHRDILTKVRTNHPTWHPRRAIASALALGAIATMLIGTFLPWVQSGSVARNSYAIADMLRRWHFFPDGSIRTAVALWPVITICVLTPVILAACGLWRTAGLLLAVIALTSATAMGYLLVRLSGPPVAGIYLLRSGPWTVLIGAVIALVAGLGLVTTGSIGRPAQPISP